MPTAIEEVKLWRMANGGLPQQEEYPEAASQTFKRGDFVYLVSGKVTEAVAPGSDLLASGNAPIGIAAGDATGTTDAACTVIILDEELQICLPVTHVTAASAITAVARVGTAYDLENVTGKGYAVTETTVSPLAKVVAIADQYPVGENFGWEWVKIIAAERALN